jgi:hypothetical protein
VSLSLFEHWTVRVSSTSLQAEKMGRGWKPQRLENNTQPTSREQVSSDLSHWCAHHLKAKMKVGILLQPSLSLVGTVGAVSSWLSNEEKKNLAQYVLQNKLGVKAPYWQAQVDQVSLTHPLLWCAVPATLQDDLKPFSSRIQRLQPVCLYALAGLEKKYTGWLVCSDEERVQTLLLKEGYVISARNWAFEDQDKPILFLQRHVTLCQLDSSYLSLPKHIERQCTEVQPS